MKERRAFITGSYAYGIPTESSDIDLCVLLRPTNGDCPVLWKNSDSESSCRFGKLNLITFVDEEKFDRWFAVTEELISRKPVIRDEAIATFQKAGFGEYGEAKPELVELIEDKK